MIFLTNFISYYSELRFIEIQEVLCADIELGKDQV